MESDIWQGHQAADVISTGTRSQKILIRSW